MKLHIKRAKVGLSILLTLCLCIVTFPVVGVFADNTGGSLIQNGDFETGDLSEWLNEWGLSSAISTDAHSGSYSMKVEGGQWNAMAQNPAVEANTEYTITFWAKRAEGDGIHHLWIKNGDTTIKDTTIDCVAADGWKKYEAAFNSGSCTEVSVRFGIEDASSVFLIDDVVMAKKTASGDDSVITDPNVVFSDDFESNANTWQQNCNQCATQQDMFSIASGAGRNGSKGLLYTCGHKWKRVFTEFSVEANTNYEVSFDYYAPSEAEVYLAIRKPNTTNELLTVNANEIGEWTTATGTFNSGEQTSVWLCFITGSDIGAGNKQIDNIVVRKIDGALDSNFENGDFETGDMSGWTVMDACQANIVEDAHGGDYAVSLAGTEWQSFSQKVNVESNKLYKITFWAKFQEGAGEHALFVKPGDVNENLYSLQIKSSAADGWKQYSLQLDSKENTVLNLVFCVVAPTAVYLIDDITFQVADAMSYDGYLKNGDFESGDLSEWLNEWNLNSAISTDAHGGSYSMKVEGGQWNAMVQNPTVKANTDYTLSFWAKRVSGAGIHNLWIKGMGSNDNIVELAIDCTAEDWTKYEATFNSGSFTQLTVRFGVNDKDSVFLIDDVVMGLPAVVTEVVNGDFETGDLSSWINEWNMTSAISEDAHGGSYSMKVEGGQWNAMVQYVGVEPDTDYVVTFWAKIAEGSGTHHLWIKNETGTDQISDTFIKSSDAAEWTEYKAIFNSKDYEKVALRFGVEDESAKFLIDDVTIAKYVAPVVESLTLNSFGVSANRPKDAASNLVANGGFESDENALWNADTFLGDTLSVVEHDDAREGSKVLYFNTAEVTAPEWHIFWVDVEPNTAYTFSAWVKGAFFSEENDGRATFGVVDPDNKQFMIYKPLEWRSSTGTLQLVPPAWDNEWHLRSVAFNSGEKTQVGIAVYGYSSQMYLDDIALYKSENGVAYSNPFTTESIRTNINVEHAGCTDEDNLIENGSLSEADSDFWQTGLGWDNGFVSVLERDVEYGNSLQYTASEKSAGTHYIKWIDVEPNTDYTFSMNILIQESGHGYLALLDDKITVPTAFMQVNFDQDLYGTEWTTAMINFNSGIYSRIGIAIVDKGGQALLDNIRIFESANGIDVEDTFVEVPSADDENDGSNDGQDDGSTVSPPTGVGIGGLLIAGAAASASAASLRLSRKKRK